MAFAGIKFSMDRDWRFHLGEYEDATTRSTSHFAIYSGAKSGGIFGAATKNAFDDSGWEQVDLPHDYLCKAEFSDKEIGNHGCRVKRNAWYRKTFTLDPALEGKHALLVFGGIATSCVIYLNGSEVHRCESGYTEIAADVTDRLYFDRVNTLAVYTRGGENEGWWYEGAGIYRHAYLYVKENIHFAHNGVFAKPILADEGQELWEIELHTDLENTGYEGGEVAVRAALYDGEVKIAAGEGAPVFCAEDGKTHTVLRFFVKNPTRWDVDAPKLYNLRAELLKNGEAVDSVCERIGFRVFYMDPDKGAFLNGRPIKLKGTCNHQDHAGVGVAVPDSIQYYRVRLLKEMGCNAYRCAHNPPAREILDACDEYGLLVMDENRRFEASEDAIAYCEAMVRRDRNHPCVVFWSLFNEEPLQNSAEGRKIFRRLKSRVRRLDDSRLIIGAINDAPHAGGAGEEMDVLAMNYCLDRIESVHRDWPDKPMMGSENVSAFATRGCYRSDREVAQITSCYDDEKAPWGHTIRENWRLVRQYDFFAGCFVWSGFDYRGEPTPFKWPSCSSQFGLMDLCGFPKDVYYFCQATYSEKPMMHLMPHWNWKEGETVRVKAVSNCEEVELFVNGRSLGRLPNDVCEQNEWQVPFEAGVIRAVGYNGGKAAAQAQRRTAGVPVAVRLTADRTCLHNAGGDTVPVRVSLVDADGVEVPTADNRIRFTVEGDGRLLGVGNGDPNSHEAEHLPERRLFAGLCQAIISADTGAEKLKLTAECEGMQSACVTFEIEARDPMPYIPTKANWAVTGVLATLADEDGKPDPAAVYGDDDMNTFSPITIEPRSGALLPRKFYTGWRVLRVPIHLPAVIPEGRRPIMEIARLRCRRAEFYVNGAPIGTVESRNKEKVTIPLPADCGLHFEVRVLMQAEEGTPDEPISNGVGGGMVLTFTDK